MAKEKDLIEQYRKYMKKGKIDQFIKYLQENDLTQEFIKKAFNLLYMKTLNNSKEQEDAIDLTNFVLMISRDKLTALYGEKLANRFMQIVYNTPYPSKRMMDIVQLTLLRKDAFTEKESIEIEKIIDLNDNKNSIIGTHITGHEIGEKLCNEGIVLTGHKFTIPKKIDCKRNIKSVLKSNITFFENDTIGLVYQIIQSKKYNNYGNDKYNDTMIVSIPKEDKEDIIIQDNYGIKTTINPKYIKGFVRVDIETGHIEGYHDNLLFTNEKTEFNSVQDLTDTNWEKMFKSWYESCKCAKMQSNIIGFFKKVLDKDKNRDKSIEETIDTK